LGAGILDRRRRDLGDELDQRLHADHVRRAPRRLGRRGGSRRLELAGHAPPPPSQAAQRCHLLSRSRRARGSVRSSRSPLPRRARGG
jgi:hypothetical protein